MEKKISFGFNKISKKSNIFANKLEPKDDKNKIELIKCLEGQSIQLLEEKVKEAPLIIPLKDDRKTSAALLSLRTRQAVLNGEEIPIDLPTSVTKKIDTNDNGVENIEKRAARELLAEISKEEVEDESVSTLVLPIKAEDLPLDGAKESNMDDYDSIPITQFGKAMLRGMGWKEQPKKKGEAIEEAPMVRPKGMGLGADKALKPKPLLVPPEANEILEIKKTAFVRVLGGKHKDLYGQIEGLDDHAGRVIVKMALGGNKESFNEFMVQPVSKKEYTQYSKCINSMKYDEYKRMENEHGQIVTKKEDTKREIDNTTVGSHYSKNRNDEIDQKHERHKSSRRNSCEQEKDKQKTERRSRSLDRRDDDYSRSSTSHRKYSNKRTPSRHRSKSKDTQSSDSSTYRSKHKKKSSKSKKSKKSKEKKHDRRNSSDLSSDDERRHKKKTKKSKRGRSRSRSKGRR